MKMIHNICVWCVKQYQWNIWKLTFDLQLNDVVLEIWIFDNTFFINNILHSFTQVSAFIILLQVSYQQISSIHLVLGRYWGQVWVVPDILTLWSMIIEKGLIDSTQWTLKASGLDFVTILNWILYLLIEAKFWDHLVLVRRVVVSGTAE